MDEELKKLWETIGKASRAAAAAGESPLTREEIDGWLQTQSKGKFGIGGAIAPAAPAPEPAPQPLGRGIASSFTQGLMLEGGDELGVVDPAAEPAVPMETVSVSETVTETVTVETVTETVRPIAASLWIRRSRPQASIATGPPRPPSG
jgi:hypothetical protein